MIDDRATQLAGGQDAADPAKAHWKGFFDDYPRFGETSTTASDISRLNYRYDLIIKAQEQMLRDKVVLDFASHDGRFSFAALQGGGARKVIGIEPRKNLVKACRQTFRDYGVPNRRYEFICADGFEAIRKLKRGSVDTVMVLGFLYHTARQYEFFSLVSALGAKNVIVDCRVLEGETRPIIELREELTRANSQIWDATRSKVLSGDPSASALKMLMEEFGYSVSMVPPLQPVPPTAGVYRTGRRVTMTGSRS